LKFEATVVVIVVMIIAGLNASSQGYGHSYC
jgi:hypothetical protein